MPKVLPEASAEILEDIAATTFRDFTDQQVPYVTPEELNFLTIPKGSLDPDERRQIESHVTHTYNFLMQIPWTTNLAQVANIAHGHHEKLDGTGYPRGIQASQIAIQTRIMTVSDIFEVKSRFVCKSGGSSSPSARLLGRPPVSGGVRGRGNAGRPRRVWS